MPNLDICTCKVAINEKTVVYRGENNPLNYAEVELLRFTLGERAISDLVVIRTEDRTNQDVLQALRLKYGNRQVGEAFPGTRPRLPMEAPADEPRLNEEPKVSAAALKKRAQRAKAKAEEAEEAEETPENDLGDVFETSEES